MIRCVVFDLDGTLADTSQDLAIAMNHVLTTFGRSEKPPALLTSYIGDGIEIYLSKALDSSDRDLIQRAKPVFADFYARHLVVATQLYPGVRETLDTLRADGIACFILSNKPDEFIAPIVAGLGIAGHFTACFGQFKFKNTKPDPEGLIHILASWKFSKDETLIVGDNHTDIETGRNAGVRSVFCSFGLGQTAASRPDFTINGMGELTAIVRSIR